MSKTELKFKVSSSACMGDGHAYEGAPSNLSLLTSQPRKTLTQKTHHQMLGMILALERLEIWSTDYEDRFLTERFGQQAFLSTAT